MRHKDGISPAWPLGYDVFEPYYTRAEALYHVHGQRCEDPTEPWSGAPYAYPPVKHEPLIQQLNDILLREGLHPFHLPLGISPAAAGLGDHRGLVLWLRLCGSPSAGSRRSSTVTPDSGFIVDRACGNGPRDRGVSLLRPWLQAFGGARIPVDAFALPRLG